MNKKYNVFDAYTLKIIAIVCMTLQHIGIVMSDFLPLGIKCIFYTLGGVTFPIMAYLLCEGYTHTKNIKKYASRLLIFALITEIPYFIILMRQLNILFTLYLGLAAIYLTQKTERKLYKVFITAGIAILSITCDWGLIGVLMIICYFYLKNHWLKLVIPTIFPLLLLGAGQLPQVLSGNRLAIPDLLFSLGCLLSIPFLAGYAGERGKTMKYFFYAYYPVHIVILGILHFIMISSR